MAAAEYTIIHPLQQTSIMNPADFQNKPPVASTSTTNSLALSYLNGTTNTFDASSMNGGAAASSSQAPTPTQTQEDGSAPTDDKMGIEEDDEVRVEEEEEKPKSRKELLQDKKDMELGEVLDMMEEWKPIIPDEVTDYYLQRSGFETSDLRVKRLLALAAQRFVSSISADAYQYARTRTAANLSSKSTKEGARAKDRGRTVLTMEDLSNALREHGVGADRAPYYL